MPGRRYGAYRLAAPRRLKLLSALLLLMPLGATAFEIGAPAGTPVIGESLRLEFPIRLAGNDKLPAGNCFTLAARPDDVAGDMYPDGLRFALERRGANAVLIVKTTRGIARPIVGFRVQIACDVGIARDFAFFSSEREIASPARRQAMERQARDAAARTRAALPAGMTEMVISRDTRLNWMAHGLYPTSLAMRDEYRRLMKAANPELFGHVTNRVGSVHIPAGTVLRIPANLPQKELPAKSQAQPKVAQMAGLSSPPPVAVTATADVPQARTDDQVDSEQQASAASAPPAPVSPRPAAAAADRLVIGSGQGRVPSLGGQAIGQTLERLEQMMAEKSESDVAMSETLTSLASSFGEVKTYLQGVDERIKRAEAGQQQAQNEIASLRGELRSSFSLLELLLAVIGGSLLGAGLIAFFQRRRQPAQAPTPVDSLRSLVPAAPPAAPANPFAATRASPATAARAGQGQGVSAKTLAVDAVAHSGAAVSGLSKTSSATRIEPAVRSGSADSVNTNTAAAAAAVTGAAAAAITQEQAPEPQAGQAPQAEQITPSAPPQQAEPSVSAAPAASATSDTSATSPAAGAGEELKLPASFSDPVLELADVMTSLGLHDEAATTVLDHIRQHPDQDPSHWFKVLEIYRSTGNRDAFDTATQELRQKLNVAVDDWTKDADGQAKESLEDFPHIAQNLQSLWPRPECEAFLTQLLEDNRDGKRQGFPRPVAEEIVLLRSMLRQSMQLDFPPLDVPEISFANELASETGSEPANEPGKASEHEFTAPPAASQPASDSTDSTDSTNSGLELSLEPTDSATSRESRPLP